MTEELAKLNNNKNLGVKSGVGVVLTDNKVK